ncbi:APC family permease [soil metagenome]
MSIGGDQLVTGASRRDAGLVRAVGTWALAAAIVNGVVGGGIFSLPSAMSGAAGSYAPLAFLLCAFAMGAVVLCFAEASGRVASSGGAYAVVDVAFGPLVAFLTGLMLWVSAVLSCGGIAAAMADGLTAFFPGGGEHLRAWLILGVIGGLAAINIWGVAPAARAIGLMTVVKLLPLAILVIGGGGWLLIDGHAASMANSPPRNFGEALILALFAFSGMETPLGASGEVSRPERTIPMALFIAMGSVSALYIAIQLVCQGLLGSALASSTTPLSDAMMRINPALGALLLVGASVSRLVWIGSDILGAPRFLFAFAQDGTAPRVLARIHPVSHAPWVAILVHALLAVLLALTGTFETLALLAALVTAPIYLVMCLAAWRLRARDIALSGPVPKLPLLPLAVVIGVASMVAIFALAKPRDVAGLALLMVLGMAWYWAAKMVRGRP